MDVDTRAFSDKSVATNLLNKEIFDGAFLTVQNFCL